MRTPSYRPVEQTRFGVPYGNCLEACVATLVGVPVTQVPDPRKTLGAHGIRSRIPVIRRWLETEFGVTLETGFDTVPPKLYTYPDHVRSETAWIAGGPSPRDPSHGHAVVYIGAPGEVLHDPNPTKCGIVSVQRWYLLVPAGGRKTERVQFTP